MKIYLDSVFVLNWAISYLLLLGSAKVAGEPFRRRWLAAGSAVGAGLTGAGFLPGFSWLCSPLCKAGTAVLMVLIAFWDSRRLVRLWLLYLAFSCGLSGGMLLCSLVTGKGFSTVGGVITTGMDLRLLVAGAVLCWGVLTLLFRRAGRHGPGELLPVTVRLGNRQVLLTALRDTGNTLTDPATGRPVLVVEGNKLRNLLPAGLLEELEHPAETVERWGDGALRGRLRLLSYRAVGVGSALLLAVRADMVQVGGREYGGLLVALSPTPVSDGGGYQALFGG